MQRFSQLFRGVFLFVFCVSVFSACQNEEQPKLTDEDYQRIIDAMYTVPCEVDASCAVGRKCLDGYCRVPASVSTCVNDVDCGTGKICAGGTCQSSTGCSVDADCGAGKICSSGSCIIKPACTVDNDCGSGKICVSGVCQIQAECSVDADCGAGKICSSGSCRIKPECAADADCSMGKVCYYGACKLECPLVNGATASIIQVTDGDTLWVKVRGDNCLDKKYNIRVHGIDAPECNKIRNQYFYYECTKDTVYNNENERYGYESWIGAKSIIQRNFNLTITCDKPEAGGWCPLDNTDDRYLAYVSLSYNGQIVDFSTEMARQGLAFSHTNFASSKRGEICKAEFEALAAKAGVWSLANSFDAVVALMGKTKRSWLGRSYYTCENAIKGM